MDVSDLLTDITLDDNNEFTKWGIEALREFFTAYEVFETNEHHVIPLYIKLLHEEVEELEQAYWEFFEQDFESVEHLAAYIKEAVDVFYIAFGLAVASEKYVISEGEYYEIAQMLIIAAELQEALDDFEANNPDIDILMDAFKEVHRSNMSKLGEDGKPIRRADGKVLKGPNYSPANLTGLAQRVLGVH